MFHREQKWGLNTYLYAPKNDYKHRMYWRDLYSAEEAGESPITSVCLRSGFCDQPTTKNHAGLSNHLRSKKKNVPLLV